MESALTGSMAFLALGLLVVTVIARPAGDARRHPRRDQLGPGLTAGDGWRGS